MEVEQNQRPQNKDERKDQDTIPLRPEVFSL
jgi:hypothetical protein